MNQLKQKLDSRFQTVALFAQRNTSYEKNSSIPFSLQHSHANPDIFNHSSGVLIAPIPGMYHLYFSRKL